MQSTNLDGEKTLKQKDSPKELAGKLNNNGQPLNNFTVQGSVLTDMPNPDLYKLNKIMKIRLNNGPEETISLSAKQLLLKGAKLKNTEWAIGIVVYVGHD